MNHNLLWKPKSKKKNVEKVLVFERCKYIYIYRYIWTCKCDGQLQESESRSNRHVSTVGSF